MRHTLRLVALCLIALGVLVACSPEKRVSWDDQERIGPLGEPVEVVRGVDFYPACGNEAVVVDGVAWFPVTPTADSDVPADPLAATLGGETAASGQLDPEVGLTLVAMGFPLVVAPGPGDDIGTLVVYEGGWAYWRSDSGKLDTWLTDKPREYNWVC